MEEARGTVRIVVDDDDALYPLVIDPLATEPAWSAESNQHLGRLGYSVSAAGDVNADGFGDALAQRSKT